MGRQKPSQRLPQTFSGPVQTEWLPDGRKMKLLKRLTYAAKNGVKWVAPKGAIIDGASIPQLLWSLSGSPYCGKYRRASVLHDVYCQTRKCSTDHTHRMFYEAMLDDGVDQETAEQMYFAVKNFGPNWDAEGKDIRRLPIDPDDRDDEY